MMRRKSTRLPGFDYRSNAHYFVTLCTYQKQCLFGSIVDGEMLLTNLGKIVTGEWLKTSELRSNVHLDSFVVMPNHLHGIVIFDNEERNNPTIVDSNKSLAAGSLGAIIGQFKSCVSKRAAYGRTIWQRSYYDHIIRTEKALNIIRVYVQTNPILWNDDPENLERRGDDSELSRYFSAADLDLIKQYIQYRRIRKRFR